MSAVEGTAPHQDSRLRALPLVVVGSLLFVYVAGRAYLLPITWDEAANYLEYTRKGLLTPFKFQFAHFGANNHFLNTWLTYLTTGVFGPGEFSLRLPVLAAYLIFLYSTARLCFSFGSPLLCLSSFLILNGNPYLLDFFSLSRGYGLSYGLLAGALWYLYQFFNTNLDRKYSLASLGLGMLAVSAHLTLIHFLIALLGVIVLAPVIAAPGALPLSRRVAEALKANVLAIAAVMLFLFPTLVVIRRLGKAGAFFYGGRTGFWQDTIISVVDRSLYEKQYFAGLTSFWSLPPSLPIQVLASAGTLTVLVALVVSIRGLRRSRVPPKLYLPAVLFLLVSCSFASIAQHRILDVLYLTGRTALYLLVLSTFVLVLLLNELAPLTKVGQYCLAGAVLVLALHALNCVNLKYVLEWKLAADMKEMIQDVAAARKETAPQKFNTDVGVSLDFEAPLNFYRAVAGLTWLNVADRRAKLHPLNQFYLYTEEDWQTVDSLSFVVVKIYPLSHSRLLLRRVRPSRYQVTLSRTLPPGARLDSQASLAPVGYRVDIPAAAAERSVVTVKAALWMERVRDASAELVVVFRRGQRTYSWHGVLVQDFARQPGTWFDAYVSCFVPTEVQPGDVIWVALENANTPARVAHLEVRWLTAVD